MSRYTKTLTNGNTCVYGFDHAIGYFFDVIAEDDNDDGEEILLIEESSMFTNLSNGGMMKLMKEYDCPNEHIEYVAMDFPIP